MRERTRKQKREQRRAERKQAADLRRQNNLCLCSDDERHYATEAESAADTMPAKICETCNKPKLIVAVHCPVFARPDAEGIPMDVVAPAIIKDILK